ncbi:hypothetical protein HZC31_02495 [Candidatus Woesearchaeota archaeon]|nr:hypothetical protein [Candidatus Woesearchaeota archaeon]
MTLDAYILERVAGGSYSRTETLKQENPFLAYLTLAGIPYLSTEQRETATSFYPTSEPTAAGDAVIRLIGKTHAHGVVLRRLQEQWPYDSIKRKMDGPYFAFEGEEPVLAVPDEFILVDDAYLEKYFGQKIEDERQRDRGICNELFFALGGCIGRIIDPTPCEPYTNPERARRAEIYLTAFREACPLPALIQMHEEALRKSSFPQFLDPRYNPFASL